MSIATGVELAGEKVRQILTAALGAGNPIGGIKVISTIGRSAACPSGTDEIYRICVESFFCQGHLQRIEEEAKTIVSETFARSSGRAAGR